MRKDTSINIRVSSEDLARWKAFGSHFKFKSFTDLVIDSLDRRMALSAKKGKQK